jgi:hypothetical protein
MCIGIEAKRAVKSRSVCLGWQISLVTIPEIGGKAEAGEDETFSACLLIMDDNHRLSEWISYHYCYAVLGRNR